MLTFYPEFEAESPQQVEILFLLDLSCSMKVSDSFSPVVKFRVKRVSQWVLRECSFTGMSVIQREPVLVP